MRKIFDLYNNEGRGYKRIANYLTDQGVPTPRMSEQMRKEADGLEYKRQVRAAWTIVTVQGILDNDFYIWARCLRKFASSGFGSSFLPKTARWRFLHSVVGGGMTQKKGAMRK